MPTAAEIDRLEALEDLAWLDNALIEELTEEFEYLADLPEPGLD